ncbi:tRNA (adenosine(37)-N6)-threonylcarbamoyltransferase complex ATPase subunit type 1 TsaE [Symmachiella dynata]|uniref:tRNA (adenosine(37)-N6)-threonylcarbamoyltransferase complex ATPase subunit type 1 TsaE n=1 Tax=Symmachiella dynata TaxID=2527995 RepID=UPI0030EF74F0
MPGSESSLPTTWTYTSHSEVETAALGAAIGRAARAGAVIALVGNLGAGKTRLTRAVATALEVDEKLVTSPTFVLIQEYAGRLPVFHFDTYRLGSVDEFLDLGVEEYFEAGGVCLIEWADRVAGVLPDDVLRIEIDITGESTRVFKFAAHGPIAQSILNDVTRNVADAHKEG